MFKARLSFFKTLQNLSFILFSKHSSISRLGIFTNCKDNLGEYHSNYESGDGYADILFKDIDCRKVAIIELKSAPVGSDLVTLSETALSQIEEKNYSEPFMSNRMIQSIYAYGIAFAGKNCAVSVKKMK